MIKVSISYFGRMRFLKPYQIPVSTAMWDPKWFHDNKDQYHVFRYHNGQWFGNRAKYLMPKYSYGQTCKGQPCNYDPKTCKFLSEYRKQIFELDFYAVMHDLQSIANRIETYDDFDHEPEIVLMVYEKPDTPCSERVILKEYFKRYNYELEDI